LIYSIQKYYILVSKSQIKLITSLQQKKYRDKNGLFVAEGPKIVSDLLEAGIVPSVLFSSEDISELEESEVQRISESDLKKISFLKNANKVLGVFKIPSEKKISNNELIVALDAVRDPGNLGTIIRLCDWFGITQIICSEDTTDCYNPKVVQATMGSIARVQVHYLDLTEYIKSTSLPVYGGVMNGRSVYSEELESPAIVVLGNEGKGISEEIITQITHPITIPQFGVEKETESLNVATATAILLSEFKRTTEK
tara:strand:+ start:951 stop:1712 length:762 start_codon:yes stop_codon:yes gene_type:complete